MGSTGLASGLSVDAALWHWGMVSAFGAEPLLRLRHRTEDAELWVRDARLVAGEGYSTASASARRELARVGAIMRLRSRGRYFVHASGVVDPLGRAFVLAGDSGSGKSTIAYALARVGWRVLGDDGIVLEAAAGAVTAHAWREPLRVSAGLAGVFPELHRCSPTARDSNATLGDARRRVCAEAVRATAAPVGALVFVRRSRHRRLTSLPPLAALAKLVRQSPWVVLGDSPARRHLEALRHMAMAVPALCFAHTPDDLLGAPDLLGAWRPASESDSR